MSAPTSNEPLAFTGAAFTAPLAVIGIIGALIGGILHLLGRKPKLEAEVTKRLAAYDAEQVR